MSYSEVKWAVFESWLYTSNKEQKLMKKVSEKNFFSSREGPENTTEAGQKYSWKQARRLPYLETMSEKKTYSRCSSCLSLLPSFWSRVIFLLVLISALFLYFFQVHPYLKGSSFANFFPPKCKLVVYENYIKLRCYRYMKYVKLWSNKQDRRLNNNQLSQSQSKKLQGFCMTITMVIGLLFRTQKWKIVKL